MSDDDAELVALIDNELDEGRKTALLARLAGTKGCASVMKICGEPARRSAASLDALLQQAPLADLRRRLLPAIHPAGTKALRQIRFPRAGRRPCHRGACDRSRPMGRVQLRAVRRAGGLAHGNRGVHASLHERDLQPVEAGRRATGGGVESGRRLGGRKPYARKRHPARP